MGVGAAAAQLEGGVVPVACPMVYQEESREAKARQEGRQVVKAVAGLLARVRAGVIAAVARATGVKVRAPGEVAKVTGMQATGMGRWEEDEASEARFVVVVAGG